jgi:hypothetical protein
MRFRFAFLLIPFLAVPAFGACSNESEGQPCDPKASNGGNDDCQNGLSCQAVPNANGFRCCPPDLTRATTPECTLNSGALDGANPTPPDGSTGPGDDATEAAVEAEADAPVDTASGDASGQ